MGCGFVGGSVGAGGSVGSGGSAGASTSGSCRAASDRTVSSCRESPSSSGMRGACSFGKSPMTGFFGSAVLLPSESFTCGVSETVDATDATGASFSADSVTSVTGKSESEPSSSETRVADTAFSIIDCRSSMVVLITLELSVPQPSTDSRNTHIAPVIKRRFLTKTPP